MPFLLRNLTLDLDEREELLPDKLASRFSLDKNRIISLKIVRKGIDARKKPLIRFVYTVEFSLHDEEKFQEKHGRDKELEAINQIPAIILPRIDSTEEIIVVGSGPAGLFASLRLSEYGLKPVLIERGKPVDERVEDVNLFWSKGTLNEESNVQFGEGGAGTFSDGKLTTRIRDVNLRYVLEQLVSCGAPEDILVLAKPHIGTDQLRGVVVNLRRRLQSRGIEVLFREKLTGIVNNAGKVGGIITNDRKERRCSALILAPGHSARDTYRMLDQNGVRLEAKPFAVGLRVEHPQELINSIQFGMLRHPMLPPADYALAYNNHLSGRSVYSFCMCPGGVVVAAASESGGVVTNGMSGYARGSSMANSALVVTVNPDDFPASGLLAGIEFQRDLERKAFAAGGGSYYAPAQSLLAFLGEKKECKLSASYRPGVTEADLAALLPPVVTHTLREGIRSFDRKMRGFVTSEATLTGVETRTSAPLRIVRGDDMQSVTLQGLFPAGEGAGYAGGIMSAAIDGIRVADAVAARLMV